MDLAPSETDYSDTRLRAVQDATKMQDLASRQCVNAGIETPPYKLTELIGKGTFGRVYKATATWTKKIVAVKIMNIEEGDSLAPGRSDMFADMLNEVNTLQILNEGGARNINTIIDSLLVGHSMWIITEYCAGGSVQTLMRPAGFLPEMWIIPILREVAEAVFWVHKQGIIHRDIKCANVLIMEHGGVQLCDFGVAGIMRSKFEKRRTITGTLQWMAPELFDTNVTYGNEVDIWAFGSMAYEAATGFPPNATTLLEADIACFGAYLRESCPRLQGDEYSDPLKDLISFCMAPDPAKRPRIEDVQDHPYIHDSTETFPTSSLKVLVSSYKKWEKKGGYRQSLFTPEGAQSHTRSLSGSIEDEGWDYGTMDEVDQLAFHNDLTKSSEPSPSSRPPLTRRPRHRRRPLSEEESRPMKHPLLKAFDPNTMSSYQEHARAFYHHLPPTASDSQAVPSSPRTNLAQTSAEDTSNDMAMGESPIRNGATLGETEPSSPATPDTNLNTIKPKSRSISSMSSGSGTLQLLFSTSRTQDWTFPSMAPAHPNHRRRTSSSRSLTHHFESRSRSSSTTFSFSIESPSPGMEIEISSMSQIDEPLLPRRGFRTDSFTISSRISLIDLDASLVSPSRPGIIIPSSPSSNNHINTYTESFPPLASPPSNTYPSITPGLSSTNSSHSNDDDLSSSTSTLKSPTDNYPQSQTYHPSPLPPSPRNENAAPNHPRTTHTHHRRKDSGYYASSSSISSNYRSRARTNSSSQSLASCCATPLQGPHSCTGRCQCHTIDETLALDETPPRHGRHQRPVLRRQPSLYLPCSGDDDGVGEREREKREGEVDSGHRGLFLPRISLGNRTASDESLDFGGMHGKGGLGSPTRVGRGGGRVAGGNFGGGGGPGKRVVQGPALPQPPRAEVVLGMGSKDELRDELQRLLGSMASHLQHAGGVMIALPSVGPPQSGQGLGGGPGRNGNGNRRGGGGLGMNIGVTAGVQRGDEKVQSHFGVSRGGRGVWDG